METESRNWPRLPLILLLSGGLFLLGYYSGYHRGQAAGMAPAREWIKEMEAAQERHAAGEPPEFPPYPGYPTSR